MITEHRINGIAYIVVTDTT